MDSILSVDLGTTALKIMLFEANGHVLAKSTQEYTLLTPSALAVELPVEAYWEAFKRGLAELLAARKPTCPRYRSSASRPKGRRSSRWTSKGHR